jgi:hypothetical protein
MKEDSDNYIPLRKVFSTLVTDGYRIPLFRGKLMPRHGDELNAAIRNNDFATTEETRIK